MYPIIDTNRSKDGTCLDGAGYYPLYSRYWSMGSLGSHTVLDPLYLRPQPNGCLIRENCPSVLHGDGCCRDGLCCSKVPYREIPVRR